jgi:exosortase
VKEPGVKTSGSARTVKTRATIVFALLPVASFLFLYRDVLRKLIHDWSVDENYSHGFLVIPMALYLAWERRERFAAVFGRPNSAGLLVVTASLCVLVAGVLGAEVFTTEISLIGTTAGSVLFLFGWRALRVMLFPIAFLLLMVPIPAIVFNQIAFPLQLLASKFAETIVMALGIPVLREGNVINLANTSLEVAEACSGIRSLISLLTLGIVYGYFLESRQWIRVYVGIATVPVAILANGFRVAGTGVAAHYIGPEVAEGFFHTFSGWLVFVAAAVMLFAAHRLVVWFVPEKVDPAAPLQDGFALSIKHS